MLWRPESREELDEYIQWHLGIKIPDRHVCLEPDHTSPMDFFWAMWSGEVEDALVWANRSGSKSFLAGLLTFLCSVHLAGCETTILGGSLDQSQKSYKAADMCWDRTNATWLVEGDRTMRHTALTNGSWYEVLTQSEKSARGPHPQHLYLDEIDQFIREVYEAALSQPQSKHGISSQTIKMSTMHRAYGLMHNAVQQAAAQHVRLFKWCVWEILEACRDWNCSSCPFTSAGCPGKERMLGATGYYLIADAIKKYCQLSEDAWRSEWLCQRPRREGLVYPECAGWNEPDAVDRCVHIVRDFIPPPEWEHYRGYDFGLRNPYVCGWWARDPKTDELFLWSEYYLSDRTSYEHAQTLRRDDRNRGRKFLGSWADPSGANERAELLAAGLPTDIPPITDKLTQIEWVRRRLKITRATGRPRLLVCEGCVNMRREMSGYHLPKEREGQNPSELPVKKDDHTCNMAEYTIAGVDYVEDEDDVITAEDLGLVEPVAIGSDYGSEEI